MLLLAHAAIPRNFDVATVDHGLRAEAVDECALVLAACEARGIPCQVLRVEVGAGNLQAEARTARYAALAEWSGGPVATAHHADDQAETLLMRLNRGSGVAGLAGVRERVVLTDPPLVVLRPLLGFRRTELRAIVERSGVAFAQDPSNADERYDRVRIRKALAQADWIDPAALAQSARNLSDAYDALQDYARLLWPQMVEEVAQGYAMTPGPLREMNRRVLAQVLERLGGKPRGGDVARLLMRLEAGAGGNVAGVLATAEGGRWLLRHEPPRRTG